jgi:hypothetical protein
VGLRITSDAVAVETSKISRGGRREKQRLRSNSAPSATSARERKQSLELLEVCDRTRKGQSPSAGSRSKKIPRLFGIFGHGNVVTGLAISGRKATQVPPALCDATTASPLNRSGRAYLRSSDQAALDQPIGYQLLPMQVGSANPRKNGCDRSDCQGWRERQSSRR